MSIKIESKKKWFVLCTKPRHELKVLEYLKELNIQAYTPTKIEVRRWSDRKKKIKTCLLPSMVLVRLQENEVNKVFDVPGVKRYLFVNGKRAVVYNYEVIAMKNYLDNKFEVEKESKIEIGNTIDIPFLKQEGKIIAMEGKKCIVRLKILGATMSFQLR